jgi:hypothetical protein
MRRLWPAALCVPTVLLAALPFAVPARAEPPPYCQHALDAISRGDGQVAADVIFGTAAAADGRQKLIKLLEEIGNIAKHRRLLIREQMPDDTTGGTTRQMERWRFDFGLIAYAGCVYTAGDTAEHYGVSVQFALTYDAVVKALTPSGGDSGGGHEGSPAPSGNGEGQRL